MSELKRYLVDIKCSLVPHNDGELYLKYEADKVIEELEESHKKEVEQLLMEIVKLKDKLRHYPIMVTLLESNKKEISELKVQKAQAEDDCAYWKAKAQRERHHKFKRCLAMAKWCHDVWFLLRFDKEAKKSVFYWRWWNIWLELAEKFKEVK